ncbi:immunity repressor [Mycobacterium phage Norz]|nr:immunity repressor [Mycobacterium phage Norz]
MTFDTCAGLDQVVYFLPRGKSPRSGTPENYVALSSIEGVVPCVVTRCKIRWSVIQGGPMRTTREQLPRLSLEVIEALKATGETEADIARMYGVTPQAVSWHVHTYGGKLTARQVIRREYPFKVPEPLSQCTPHKRLRDHGEYIATRGKGMKEYKLKRLRSFYRMLRENNWVVEFDPNIPPIPGVSKRGGWAYRERQESDEDLLIRVNEYTTLSEIGRHHIWRFPSVEP